MVSGPEQLYRSPRCGSATAAAASSCALRCVIVCVCARARVCVCVCTSLSVRLSLCVLLAPMLSALRRAVVDRANHVVLEQHTGQSAAIEVATGGYSTPAQRGACRGECLAYAKTIRDRKTESQRDREGERERERLGSDQCDSYRRGHQAAPLHCVRLRSGAPRLFKRGREQLLYPLLSLRLPIWPLVAQSL